MIIDADVHISPSKEGGNSITMEELIERMDRAGVDKALTWLQPPYLREIDNANAYVYKATRRYPSRILGFGWADPNLGVEKARDMVKRCVCDYGFYGVKLNGAQNSFYIDDPAFSLPVIEEIAESGKILAFHVGTDAYEYTHPFRVAKVARMYPEMPILLVHMGGVGSPDMGRAVMEFARECTNLILIGSAINEISIVKAIEDLGASRVCFGSDTPFFLMHVQAAKYRALLEGMPEGEREMVMGGNIVRLFGLR
ncbi:MAG: amidohydrolase family protein [Bacillota bacterium]